MEIRQATAEELKDILALQRLAFYSVAEAMNHFDIPPLVQTMDELEEEFHRGILLVATIDGKIVGSIRGYFENNTLYIGKLIVHPSHQKQGIGRALLQAIEAAYPGVRYELFTSSRTPHTAKLYESCGYREFDRRPFYQDEIFIYMEKE